MGKSLQDIINEVDELPTLPQIAHKVMQLLDDPDSSTREIQDVMIQDPGLAGRILKLANSSYYGLTNKVSSLQQAIVILGFRSVRSIALSACVFDIFPDSQSDTHFDIVDFWKHCIISASVCKGLSTRCEGLDEEEAFVAGLLHDVGKMVIKQFAPEEMKRILETAKINKSSFIEAEHMILDTTHAEVGGWLIHKWGLPEYMTDTIAHHHDIANARATLLAASCSFANYICKVKGLSAPGSFETANLDKQTWNALKLDRKALPRIISHINQEIQNAESILEIVQP